MDTNLALEAHKQSIALAMAGEKEKWLDLFTDDAVVHDPVGVSPHDPEGQGFRGKARLAEFWDAMIGPADLILIPHKRICCGDSIAAVFMTAANSAGVKTYIEMMAIYEADRSGKLVSLKVYWDIGALQAQFAAAGIQL